MTIDPTKAYMTRTARVVTILGRAPGRSGVWAWITSRGYYVTADGRATPHKAGETPHDLVREARVKTC